MSVRTTFRMLALAAPVLSLTLMYSLGAVLVGCSSTGGSGRASGKSSASDALRTQIDQADATFDARAYDQALELYKALYLAASGTDFREVQAEVAAQIATTYATQDRTDDGDQWMQRAEEFADESQEFAWSRLLLARGMRFYRGGNNLSASATFKQLYSYCILNAQTPRAMQAATLASLTSIGQEQLDWSLRAIQAAQSANEPSWESELWSTHGWLLDTREQYEDAALAFEKARELAGLASVSRVRRLHTDWQYGHGLRNVGKLEEARDVLMNANGIAHSRYVAKPSQRLAEVLGRVLWEIAEVDALEGSTARARERYIAAREKLLEAGAGEQAPELIEQLEARLRALDEPTPVRRIPPKEGRKKKNRGADDAGAR